MKGMELIANHRTSSEKSIERYLCKQLAILGLMCYKTYNPNDTGMPDRLIILPAGKVVWAEIKSEGERPSPLQAYRFDTLRMAGHDVHVIDSKEKADELLETIKTRIL